MSTKSARYLLDVNVLVALAWPTHMHHATAHAWFSQHGSRAFATCTLTQLGFVRISMNPVVVGEAVTAVDALRLAAQIAALPGHTFLEALAPCEASASACIKNAVGHRQVNDAYLVAIAQQAGGLLATFDKRILGISSAAAWKKSIQVIAT